MGSNTDYIENTPVSNCEHNSELTECRREVKKLSEMLTISQENFVKQTKECKELRDQLRQSEDEKEKSKSLHTTILEDLFHPDQIRSLEIKQTGGKNISKWSELTVEKALQLKLACGDSGYEALLRQNFPLPSLRALREKSEHPYLPNDKNV